MSWRKATLGDLCTIEKGKTGIQKAIPGNFPLVVTAEERKSHNEYQFDDEAVIIPLVSGTGHGHASIKRLHFQSGKFALGTILCAVIPKNRNILNAEYLFRFLTLNKDRELVDRMKGMANVTLPIKEIAKIEIPLPSLDDQIEFVEKYKLLETNTEEITDELTYQLDLIKQLRQAFLREAMQGKLIKSTNTTETAHQLLAQIKTEKAKLVGEKKFKKEKELPSIVKDEIPFEIPEHWAWCRLGEICTKITDGFHNTPPKVSTGFPYIAATQVKSDKIDWENCNYVEEKFHRELYNKTMPKKGEVLVVNIGAGCGTPALIDVEFEFSFKNTAILKFNQNLLINKYLFYYFILRKEEFYVNLTKGGLQPFLSLKILNNIEFPLPPLHEQKQIVAKLEELMVFCDGLEKSIKESQDYNDMLLQQVLREALQPKNEPKIINITNRKIENPLKTILAGHIINLNNTTDFGRVKFQKLLFLTEYICKIDFESNYIKKVAGPYDDSLIRNIEADFNRMRFFNVVQDNTDNKRVRYHALAGATELETLFLENFSDESVRINNTLLKFRPLSWGECELIATLYAVWNNRIIKNELITDELLYSDFMAWDEQKKKYQSVFHKWLFWMKDEKIVPDGWGKYIDKPN